jgi:hypothetical protein
MERRIQVDGNYRCIGFKFPEFPVNVSKPRADYQHRDTVPQDSRIPFQKPFGFLSGIVE